MLDQAKISFRGTPGFDPKHRLLQSAEDCAGEESSVGESWRAWRAPAPFRKLSHASAPCLSINKRTSGQKGEGHKITHHSSVTRKSLTGDSLLPNQFLKISAQYSIILWILLLLGNSLLRMTFDRLVEKLYRDMTLPCTIVSKGTRESEFN